MAECNNKVNFNKICNNELTESRLLQSETEWLIRWRKQAINEKRWTVVIDQQNQQASEAAMAAEHLNCYYYSYLLFNILMSCVGWNWVFRRLKFIVLAKPNRVKYEFARMKIGRISTQLASRKFSFVVNVQFNTCKPNEIYKRKNYFCLNFYFFLITKNKKQRTNIKKERDLS